MQINRSYDTEVKENGVPPKQGVFNKTVVHNALI